MRPEGLAEALRVTPTESVRSLVGGDMVLVDVIVVTPSPRDYVAIDDPLPAGLEAVDTSLATTARDLADLSGDDADHPPPDPFAREIRDDRVVLFADHLPAGLYRYRYLARATTLGKFVLPPTRAEEMYSPEVFGRTAADVIIVTTLPH